MHVFGHSYSLQCHPHGLAQTLREAAPHQCQKALVWHVKK